MSSLSIIIIIISAARRGLLRQPAPVCAHKPKLNHRTIEHSVNYNSAPIIRNGDVTNRPASSARSSRPSCRGGPGPGEVPVYYVCYYGHGHYYY